MRDVQRLLDAVQERGRDKDSRQRVLDASFEVAVLTALLIEDHQRFDFVVRTRRAFPSEIIRNEKLPAGTSFPQRDAVLTALRALSGKDFGTDAESWREYAKGIAKK